MIPLSRRNFGFLRWPQGRKLAGLAGSFGDPDEGVADEARHYLHRVLGQAEFQIPRVPEASEPPRRAVVPELSQGAIQITLDDAACPPVQLDAAGPQPAEDGPCS